MQQFRSFSEVHSYLGGLMSETRGRHEAYTLDRMQALMAFLGNPQDSFKTIHIAGTSGKSSTCYYLSSMLTTAGKKTGLTVSPHLDEVNERLQINNKPLDEQAFCRELSVFLQEIQPSGIWLSYFELLVAFAYWEFARQNVDYAVVETGLGGLLDGTNVINRNDKVCIITDIGFDHTSTLGKTLTAIAGQKAGIILPGNEVLSYQQNQEIMDVLRETCRQKHAELHEITPNGSPVNLPLFQRRNWQLAHAGYQYVAKRDKLPELNDRQQSATAATHIPARMETLHVKHKTIIMDGAHNPQKLGALVKSIEHAYPDQKLGTLVSFVRNPEAKVHDNLAVLKPIVSHLITTSFRDDEVEHYSTDPSKLASQCKTLGYEAYEVLPDLKQALNKLLKRPEPILLITGSFFLLQLIRPLIINMSDTSNRNH